MPQYLAPLCNDQTFDANGDPLTGGQIETYLAGSSTPAATYTDEAGLVQQSNPIILNSLGYPTLGPIWLTGGRKYKFIIKTSLGVTLRSIDNIAGINDASVSQSEWVESGLTPTYISAVSFSVPGDQTGILQIGRRLRTQNTSGFIFSSITNSVFAAGVTTVTVVNDSGVLDAGLSSVAYSLLSADDPSIPAIYAKLASPIFTGDPQAPTPADGDEDTSIATTGFVASGMASVRQTVLNGPVDTSGFAAFGGSTGSTTVTAAGTLTASAANGLINRRGRIVNPSWTSLNQNGTMFLYLDIAQGGTCTTGSTTLAPTYRWGGADVTTNSQFTFNIQEMVGKVGNGSAATQTYRVFVGEVTVAGAVVTAITWYALMGRAVVDGAAMAGTTTQSLAHNVGLTSFVDLKLCLVNLVTEGGWAVGDELYNLMPYYDGTTFRLIAANASTRNVANVNISAGTQMISSKAAATFNASVAFANWKPRVYAQRKW